MNRNPVEHRFWMIYSPQKGVIEDLFTAKQSASIRARRIARENVGCDFYVLRSIERVTAHTEIRAEKI